MSFSLYGMPILQSSIGLMTIFNMAESGSLGARKVFIDQDLSTKIFSIREKEAAKYAELAKLARQEFSIKKPEPSKLSNFWWSPSLNFPSLKLGGSLLLIGAVAVGAVIILK